MVSVRDGGGRVKSVAIIGAGPSGAAAIEALGLTGAFEKIKLFERRSETGGSWIYDPEPRIPPANPSTHPSIVDSPCVVPEGLPRRVPKSKIERWDTSPVYPNLTTNVNIDIMSFTHSQFSEYDKTPKAIEKDPMFPSHSRVKNYVAHLLEKHSNDIVLGTTVEQAVKTGSEWHLTLRRQEKDEDYWYSETFDALIVATGQYSVPRIPDVPGLKEYNQRFKGRALHSKYFRDPQKYQKKHVLIVGNGITALDIIRDTLLLVSSLTVSSRGVNMMYPEALENVPGLVARPTIQSINPSTGEVVFVDDSSTIPDYIIFATGYHMSFPYLPPTYAPHNHDPTFTPDWVPGTYLHTFYRNDPTLCFIGLAVYAVSFRNFEYQAAVVAEFLSGRLSLPEKEEMKTWEDERLKLLEGNTAKFHIVMWPESKEFIDMLQGLTEGPSEEPGTGFTQPGMKLSKWKEEWTPLYKAGVEERARRVGNLRNLLKTRSVL